MASGNILTRKSVLAVVKETTQGDAVKPSSSDDFIALQTDFTMSPEIEQLTNDEIRDSIGLAKTIPGLQTFTGSGSHYLRHSGVEGQAPDYDPLLECCFGASNVASTEYLTDAGSTTKILQMLVGEAANFQRGQAVLIKDDVNGYSIRVIDSVDTGTDELHLSFALDAAPAAGVATGLAITYLPDDCPGSLSFWYYTGNGGAICLGSGARITSMATTIAAGQLINSNYSFSGINFSLDPICIDATNDTLDFTDDDGTFAVTVEQKIYDKPQDLACTLELAMNAVTTQTHTVTYSNSTGKYTIANTTGALLDLDWDTGPNTAVTIGVPLGYDVSADDTGSLSYEGDDPIDLTAPYSLDLDDSDPLAAKNMEVFCGDCEDNMCIPASELSLTKDLTEAQIQSVCAATGLDSTAIVERAVGFSITSLLEPYDVDKYCRVIDGDDTRMEVNFGTKDKSGNWEAGKSGAFYVPTGTLTTWSKADQDGFIAVTVEGVGFVNKNGDGEIYLNFV